MRACGLQRFDYGKRGASLGFGDSSATNINSDAPGSRAAPRDYVHLAGGRRLSPNEWGHPAGRPVLEFRGLPSSRGGDAIDLAVLTHARIRRIPVDRPALRVIIGGGFAMAVTALIGQLFHVRRLRSIR